MPPPHLRPGATYEQVRAWLLDVDPDLVAAADDVDRTLIADTLRLSLSERLDKASATAAWLMEFRRAAAR